jgi:hypothetical protein
VRIIASTRSVPDELLLKSTTSRRGRGALDCADETGGTVRNGAGAARMLVCYRDLED